MKNVIVFLVLLTLACAGCAEKKVDPSNGFDSKLPYTVNLPDGWLSIPYDKMVTSHFKAFVMLKDSIFDGAFTGAPSEDARFPLVVFSRTEIGKGSMSEILMINEELDHILFDSERKRGVKVVVNRKEFDKNNMRTYLDAVMAYDNGRRIDMFFVLYYTQTGAMMSLGACAENDSIAKKEIKKMLTSVVLKPGFRFE